MRIKESRRGYFLGTHKGAEIEIEKDSDHPDYRFYVRVRWKDGTYMADGYTPEDVHTMAEAKRWAIKGAML